MNAYSIEMAFDIIKFAQLFKILKDTGVKFTDVLAILSLYEQQKAIKHRGEA